MSKANSETPASSSLPEQVEESISKDIFEEEVMPLLDGVICAAFRHCHQFASAEDRKRLRQRLSLHLLEKTKSRLGTFQQRSSLRTWLQKVANNYVSRFLQEERRYENLEAAPQSLFTLMPAQEDQVLQNEQRTLLAKALKKLTQREQKLIELVRQGLSAKVIARRMEMGEASVYPRRCVVIDKLRALMGERQNK